MRKVKVKGLKRNILLFFALIVSFFNKFILKKENQILFFTNLKDFNDNNRALLEYLISHSYTKKYKIYYSTISNSPFIEAENLEFISIKKGLLKFLTSKYVFYDGGTTKIKPSKQQKVISLWHGTPLKKIGGTTEKTSKFDRFNDFSYIITTSKNCIPIFVEAFQCNEEKVLSMGYPRNDFLFHPDIQSLDTIINKDVNLKVMWMPTFRKSIRETSAFDDEFGISFFENIQELQVLNDFLQIKNIFLVIKLHPLSVQNNVEIPEFSNIKILNSDLFKKLNVQNYSFLANFDILLTDYSSVYFDYLLLDRPIGFVIEDISSYKENRGFTFDNPIEMMPGQIIQTKDEFYSFLESQKNSNDIYGEKRKLIRDFIHTETQQGNACEILLDKFGIKK